ncbi:MAG: FAD-dependent oxidoreductase [Alphaproteobacteria bacterium]|nr:FAD-dependent oxidoreductase [Alphaproteobacteria bacterium]
MTARFEAIVIGGGPAGMAASVTIAAAGHSVLLVDEAAAPGGQVYRATFPGLDAGPVQGDADRRLGDVWRARLRGSAVQVASEHVVWEVGEGFRVSALGSNGSVSWRARALVAATGTTERVVPFKGWTTPGVFGLAGATVMLKAQMTLPGQNVVVAGVGPLLAAVAYKIVTSGGRVAAIVDLSSASDWLGRLPAMATRPDLLARGLMWMARLLRAGVPFHRRSTISAVHGAARVEAVDIVPVDGDRRPIPGRQPISMPCDALVIGHGLVPQTDVTGLLGALHRFEVARGGWIAERDGNFETTIPGLFIAGDGGGIFGAAAATAQGELAGHAVSRHLSGHSTAGEIGRLRRQLRRAQRFGGAMAELMALRDGQVDAITADCVVCRCEDVTRAEIDAAVDAGATDVNQMKAWTRCGMGPCQGRSCGDVAAAIVGLRVGGRVVAGKFTVRPPIRPLPIGKLTGRFDYADIPIPKPAPL